MVRRLFLFLALFILSFAPKAQALVSNSAGDETLTARLVSETDSVGPTSNLRLGLDLTLADGWHTYWRSGGEAGLPPSLDWSHSNNIEGLNLLYPAPHRAELYGMETIGYSDHVFFPLQLQLKTAEQETALHIKANILICKDLCLPKHFDLSLILPAGDGAKGSEAELIETGFNNLPATHGTDALALDSVSRDANSVSVTLKTANGFHEPDLFLEGGDTVFFAKPETIPTDNPDKIILKSALASELGAGQTLAELPLKATITNGNKALEVDLPLHPETPPPPEDVPDSRGWTMLFLALIGGFILNLMPCVLPVLSLKVLSVIKHGGAARTTIRRSFTATAAGIIFSFGALAAILILLRHGGTLIGWGVQFQQPSFIIFMIFLTTLFACNLWGFFEITLPRFVMDRIDTTHHPQLAGNFATGMLATLLATPCSAPFLGTALGFALAASAVKTMAIFLALGTGMALPYLLIAFYPRLASSLPKPGPWMGKLTKLLGFCLAGTAVWLLTVLGEQLGLWAAFGITAAMLVIIIQLYLHHRSIAVKLTKPVIAFLLIASLGFGFITSVPTALAPQSGLWEKFDEEALYRHVREGKTVFVDITADWCLTCKANKRFTLSRSDVQKHLFNDPDVIAMQGDWTTPDPALTAFLRKHGRYGIPFNAVFGPKVPGGLLLSELLTASNVIDALDEAKEPHKVCPVDLPAGTNC